MAVTIAFLVMLFFNTENAIDRSKSSTTIYLIYYNLIYLDESTNDVSSILTNLATKLDRNGTLDKQLGMFSI